MERNAPPCAIAGLQSAPILKRARAGLLCDVAPVNVVCNGASRSHHRCKDMRHGDDELLNRCAGTGHDVYCPPHSTQPILTPLGVVTCVVLPKCGLGRELRHSRRAVTELTESAGVSIRPECG